MHYVEWYEGKVRVAEGPNINILDSTVLAYVLKMLNERYSYGLDLFLLSVDEGITGYRDDSLEARPSRSRSFRRSCLEP